MSSYSNLERGKEIKDNYYRMTFSLRKNMTKCNPKNIGSTFRKLREAKKMPRQKLARIVQVDPMTIYNFEKWRTQISVDKFILLVNELAMEIVISPKE